ncbi:MAG: hypothetical protein H0Z35_00645 [Thermoanaerobacteraceae bacterium]|nr:hypothetical protein [Thermoanaerobacteraceae bacterium]
MDRELLNKVLRYPLVQYITLTRKDLVKTQLNIGVLSRDDISIQLFVSERQLAAAYFPNHVNKDEILGKVNFNKKFAVISLNYDVKDLKYRTTKITAIGQPIPRLYYLFTVDRRLFYRHKVYFQLYDCRGRKIDIPIRVYNIPLAGRTENLY